MGRKSGSHTGRSKHPWYRTWMNHRSNVNCPWITFEEFRAWAEARGYDPQAGDRIVLHYHRHYGFAPRIRKAGEPDELFVAEPELARRTDAARISVSQSRIMEHWQKMMSRCYDTKDPLYYKIGAVGIVVHKSWHDFDTFYAWAQPLGGELDGMELVRRDHYQDFKPTNCTFVAVG